MTELGHGSVAIGQTLSVVTFTKIISPYIWGYLADKSGKGGSFILLGGVGTLVSSIALTQVTSVNLLMVVLFFFSFFWNAVLPLYEATTLRLLGSNSERYGRIRVWGSISFILLALICGFLFEYVSARWVPCIIAFWALGILISIISIRHYLREELPAQKKHSVGLASEAKRFMFWFLVAMFFLHGSTSAYYAFFDLYVIQSGYHSYASGLLISFGVVVEVLFFLKSHYFIQRWGSHLLCTLAIVLTAVRWLLTAFYADVLAILLFAQFLHVFTYAVAHAAAISLLDKYLPKNFRNRGQALYSSVSFGLGGALASVGFGYTWANGAGAMETFIAAAIMCTLALASIKPMYDIERQLSKSTAG
jgi:PPP family 3-phenylpropionic acid transporter